tara:strand:- start:157 stop:663 length:507 start_codon:yes stop_codon:yes gene_type:complete
MISKVKRYFLEIKNFSDLAELNLPENHEVILSNKKDFQLNKFFYKQVGADHFWRDRLIWTDKEWSKYVSNLNFETWIMKNRGELVGFYEQLYHSSSNEHELINLGILKEYRGKKLGSVLLLHAIHRAFKKKTKRMWVHTCSLDHKFALNNYKSKGFKIFKEEEIDFVS